jgi:hypothetical protein
MTLGAKFLLNDEALMDDIKYMATAIVQNYKNIQDAITGKTHWKPNDKPIYSLIVTLEDWFIFTPEIVRPLNELIVDGLKEAGLNADLLEKQPYTVASIQEFEMTGQIIEKISIEKFFSKKTDKEHRSWSVSPFSSQYFNTYIKGSTKILFKEDWQRMLPSIHALS